MRAPSKKLKATAYHEAGHAVAAYNCRIAFTEVSIIPNDDTNGRITFRKSPKSFQPDLCMNTRTRLRIENNAIVDFAGGKAEHKFRHSRFPTRGASADFDNTVQLILYYCGSEREADAYIKWLSVRAEYLVGVRENWAAIEALASELLIHQKIGSRRARQIIRQTMESYRPSPEDWERLRKEALAVKSR